MTKPTLQLVALEAGVSASTVSRYLNGTLRLKAETEQRIRDAFDSTGYERPLRSAAVDEPQSKRIIGLVLPEVSNEYFGGLADVIIEAAEQQGYAVVICATMNHRKKQSEYVEMIASLGIAGLIYIGNFARNKALADLARSDLPLVVLDEIQSGVTGVDSVRVDDYSGAFQAVSYLVSLGHRRIALATGSLELNSVRERRRGYEEALQRAGIDPSEQTIVEGTFSDEFGASVLTQIIAAEARPTAIFAASDIIAVGVMVAARKLNVRIPQELSVVGFDDIPAAEYVTPRLTTVRTPFDESARATLALLTDRMEDARRSPRTTVVSVALEVRESAAPIVVDERA